MQSFSKNFYRTLKTKVIIRVFSVIMVFTFFMVSTTGVSSGAMTTELELEDGQLKVQSPASAPASAPAWQKFLLQHCDPSTIIIFDKEQNGNQALTLELELDSLTDMQIFLQSTNQIDATIFSSETFEITKDYSFFSLETVNIRLEMQTTRDPASMHHLTASGRYRIDNGAWQSFELQKCYPDHLQIFSDSSFIHTLLLTVNITSMDVNDNTIFIIEHSASDAVNIEEITEIGSYTYSINASFVSFTLYEIGNVIGIYTIESFGFKPRQPQLTGISPFLMLLPFLIVYLLRKD